MPVLLGGKGGRGEGREEGLGTREGVGRVEGLVER